MQSKLLSQTELLHKLAQTQVLKQLHAGKVQRVASRCSQQVFAPREYLIHFNSTGTSVFLLLSGRARATMISARGREVGYQDIFPGQMFGELSAIDGLPRSTSVIASEHSVCAVIRQEDFLELLESDWEITRAVMKHLARMARDLCEKVFGFVTLSIRERLHLELIRLAMPYQGDSVEVVIHRAPTHTQIANMIGSTREAVTREINTLRSAGLVCPGNNRTLVIPDIRALERLVNESIKN